MATIKSIREDLFVSIVPKQDPIPNVPPPSFEGMNTAIPDIGQLMMPTNIHTVGVDVSNWWIVKSFDGIRTCWNNITRSLYQPHGTKIDVPANITQSFPATIALDGELWFGRGEKGWESSLFVIHDVPHLDIPFEERYSHSFIALNMVPSIRSETKEQLKQITHLVLESGGEGVVLKRPNSLYVGGRSDDLLNIQPTKHGEALVVNLDTSTSNNIYLLQLRNGQLCEADTRNGTLLPKLGDVVTFRYTWANQRNNLIRRAKITQIRGDTSWSHVNDSTSGKKFIPYIFSRITSGSPNRHTPGYWTKDNGENIKNIFLEFAEAHNFDPLVAENWYTVTGTYFFAFKKGNLSALDYYGKSFVRALINTFPDIGLDVVKFKQTTRHYWNNSGHIKEFLDSFAARRGFDPLLAENWYKFSKEDLKKEEKGSSVHRYLNEPLSQILSRTYPGLQLDDSLFARVPVNYWTYERKRQFFDDFAKKHKFDPLVASNWYNVTYASVMAEKKGIAVIGQHGRSYVKAIMELYEEIGLNRLKFERATYNCSSSSKF